MASTPEYYDNDLLGLGWVIGERYKIWTGDIDIVLGYDKDGFVVVMDEKTSEIRKHLTSVQLSAKLVKE